MAKTWANEASELHASENHARHVPPPPRPGEPTRKAEGSGARYRSDLTGEGDRVDFDRVMLESWRPKAVRPQTDQFYVPGPGSEPPPAEEFIAVEPLSRAKIFFVASASLSALIVLTSAAYVLGRSAGQASEPAVVAETAPPVAAVEAPTERSTRVEVGAVTVEPLPTATAVVPPLPSSSVAVSPDPDEPRIRPLATPDEPAVAARRPSRRSRTSHADRAALQAEREAPSAAREGEDEAASWHSPPLAGWDDVVAPAGDG